MLAWAACRRGSTTPTTAHIRGRLAQMAVYGVIGLVIAVVAAGVIAIVASTAGGAWGALVTAGWVADGYSPLSRS